MCRSIMLLSKRTHQMWRDDPFTQRNKTIKRAVGVDVGGNGEGRSSTNFEKGGLGGLGILCQLCTYILLVFLCNYFLYYLNLNGLQFFIFLHFLIRFERTRLYSAYLSTAHIHDEMKAEFVFHCISSVFFAFYGFGILVFSGDIKW